jgi:hypothetical protein
MLLSHLSFKKYKSISIWICFGLTTKIAKLVSSQTGFVTLTKEGSILGNYFIEIPSCAEMTMSVILRLTLTLVYAIIGRFQKRQSLQLIIVDTT